VSRPQPPEARDAQADFSADPSPSDQDRYSEGLLLLTDLLPRETAPRQGSERLALAVSELPLRYAPFYGRLSSLWEVSEQDVARELARARDPRSWTLTLLRGLKTFELQGGRRGETRRRLLRFSPGVHLPRHRHRGEERVLVLEGSYADSSGCEVRPGEQQIMSAGSEHELHILGAEPCVAAIAEQGVDFTGSWLRWASKLFG
jgi:quercetin dioxygenase-like cupin family protein